MYEILAAARNHLGMTEVQLWTDYVGLGGTRTFTQVTELLDGSLALTRFDYDLLAQALNDAFIERDEDHPVPYFEDLPAS